MRNIRHTSQTIHKTRTWTMKTYRELLGAVLRRNFGLRPFCEQFLLTQLCLSSHWVQVIKHYEMCISHDAHRSDILDYVFLSPGPVLEKRIHRILNRMQFISLMFGSWLVDNVSHLAECELQTRILHGSSTKSVGNFADESTGIVLGSFWRNTTNDFCHALTFMKNNANN